MHGTSVHSLHTILAALVLLRRRICEKKKVRNCGTVGCNNDEGDEPARARWGNERSGTGYAQHFLRGNERRDCYSRHSQEKPQHMISSDGEDGDSRDAKRVKLGGKGLKGGAGSCVLHLSTEDT